MPSRKSLSLVLFGTGILLVSLGGVVGPILKEQQLAAQRAAAMADMADIGRVVDAVLKRRPALAENDVHEALHYLVSDGEMPSNNVYATGPGGLLRDWFLAAGARPIAADPWGYAYLVNLRGEDGSAEHIAILSPGPNGQVNTDPQAILPGGDDVLYVLD